MSALIDYKRQLNLKTGDRDIYIQETPERIDDLFSLIVLSDSPPSLYEHVTDVKQKPRFDIDISDTEFMENSDKYVSSVISEILKSLKSYGITHVVLEDIYIYTSHCPKGKKKSYHIIVDKVYHRNNREAKKFYGTVFQNLVSKGIDRLEDPFLDPAVYKKKQLFRLPWCEKLGSGRKKVLTEDFDMGEGIMISHRDNKTYEEKFKIFTRSLLTYCDDDCYPINIEVPDEVKTEKLSWSDPKVRAALLVINDIFEDSVEISQVYENFIILKNKNGIACPLCYRTHKSENPYIYFHKHNYDSIMGIWRMIFSCRRNVKDYGKVLGYVSDWGSRITTDPYLLQIENLDENSKKRRFQVLLLNHSWSLYMEKLQKKVRISYGKNEAGTVPIEITHTTTMGLKFVAHDFRTEEDRIVYSVRGSSDVEKLYISKEEEMDDCYYLRILSNRWMNEVSKGKPFKDLI